MLKNHKIRMILECQIIDSTALVDNKKLGLVYYMTFWYNIGKTIGFKVEFVM